jgi:hypothetical protein
MLSLMHLLRLRVSHSNSKDLTKERTVNKISGVLYNIDVYFVAIQIFL